MIVEIPRHQGDDALFLTAVNGLLARLVHDFVPDWAFAIRLNKWFDHKWLEYSGKGRVHFDGYPLIDTALDAQSQTRLTLPPFNPKQITDELHWHREEDRTYTRPTKRDWVHRRVLGHSSSNLHRRVADRWESAVLLWVSSNTATNKRGSVMVYVVNSRGQSTWYSSFSESTGWHVERVKGIAKEVVQEWFPLG